MKFRSWLMIAIISLLAFGIAFDLAFALAAFFPEATPTSSVSAAPADLKPANLPSVAPEKKVHKLVWIDIPL
jgi:hypothetical protein